MPPRLPRRGGPRPGRARSRRAPPGAPGRRRGEGAGEATTVAAQALLQLDRREDARRALERALELDPDQPLACKLLAAIRIAANDTIRGLDLLDRAARLDPTDSRPLMAMGKVRFSRMEYDEALRAFEEALRRNPVDREAREGLIVVLLDRSQDEAAGPHVARALLDEPDNPKVLGLAARQAYASGRPTEAAGLADWALARDPDEFNALLARAKVATVGGRPESALADLEQATAVDPNDVGALQMLAQVEARLGLAARAKATSDRRESVQSRREAIAKLGLVIAERPTDPALHCRMGRLAVDAGLTTLAFESYRAALALDPRSRPAREGLASLKAAAGRATPRRQPPTRTGGA